MILYCCSDVESDCFVDSASRVPRQQDLWVVLMDRVALLVFLSLIMAQVESQFSRQVNPTLSMRLMRQWTRYFF